MYYKRVYSIGPKFSLKSRIKPIDSATRDNPPPNNYNPWFTLSEESKFEKITFGFGGRPNVTGRINENPGPGTYKISSVFDKFKRIPNSSLLKTLEKYRNNARRKISKQSESAKSSSRQKTDDPFKKDDHLPLAIQNEIEGSDHKEIDSVTNEDKDD